MSHQPTIPNEIHLDAFGLLCGNLLGQGIHRMVFTCRVRDDLVVKVEFETDFRHFANVHEMKAWSDAGPAVQRWLAPCEHLSPDGRVLLQKRVEPLRKADLPETLPEFLSDIKIENFGMFEGRLVCIDYTMLRHTKLSMKLRKVTWA